MIYGISSGVDTESSMEGPPFLMAVLYWSLDGEFSIVNTACYLGLVMLKPFDRCPHLAETQTNFAKLFPDTFIVIIPNINICNGNAHVL